MITEDYVSFETAKLLKEKGFDEEIPMIYTSLGELQKIERYESIKNSYYNDITSNYFEYSAPTLQMAMKWLREVHKIHIQVEAIVPEYYEKDEYVYRFHYKRLKHIPIYNNMSYIDDTQYVSCEQACEAAIKYCLENLI